MAIVEGRYNRSTVNVIVVQPFDSGMHIRRFHKRVDAAIRIIGRKALRFWKSVAHEKLNTTYKEYVGSLELRMEPAQEQDSVEAVLSLRGSALAYMLEMGNKGRRIDFKERLSSSSSAVKMDRKGNRYMVIPMKHAASPTSKKAPKPPYEVMTQMQGQPYGTVLKGFPDKYKTISKATGYESAVPRYERMKHHEPIEHFPSGWLTFRTIHEKSDSASWIHPGFKAFMFHKRVIDHIKVVLVPHILTPLLESV